MTAVPDPAQTGRWVLTRDVKPDEFHWWVPDNLTAGTKVYRCTKCTYGCVKDFAATLDPDGGYPFFELPWDAIEATR